MKIQKFLCSHFRRSIIFLISFHNFTKNNEPLIVHNLDTENSVLKQFIAEIRDVTIQGDRMRFRRNIERIGEVLAYELSKTLTYNLKNITTPLATKSTALSKVSRVRFRYGKHWRISR